jgi:hypothetical protein
MMVMRPGRATNLSLRWRIFRQTGYSQRFISQHHASVWPGIFPATSAPSICVMAPRTPAHAPPFTIVEIPPVCRYHLSLRIEHQTKEDGIAWSAALARKTRLHSSESFLKHPLSGSNNKVSL